MSPETCAIAAACLPVARTVAHPLVHHRYRRRRSTGHSFTYRWYIDDNSLLWRWRKTIWYWTSSHRCKHCRKHLVAPRLRKHSKRRRRPGALVATFNHKNYDHLVRERRGRDIEMLCWPCHCRTDGWRHR